MTGNRVDYLVFEWIRRPATSGLTVVRGSLPEDEWALWENRLSLFVALPEHADGPSTAYLCADPHMVLLHRQPVLDGQNRESTRALALIGPPSELTFPRAAALRTEPAEPAPESWTGQGYPHNWIRASLPVDDLRRFVRPYRAELVHLISAIRAEPHANFQIQTRPGRAAPLLAAAYHCAPRAHATSEPAWTFSTSPTSERRVGIERPQFVFTTGAIVPNGQGMTRRRVDLATPCPHSDEVNDLVDFWLGPDPAETATPASMGSTAQMSDGRIPARTADRRLWPPDPGVSAGVPALSDSAAAEATATHAQDGPADIGSPTKADQTAGDRAEVRGEPNRADLELSRHWSARLTGAFAQTAALWAVSAAFIVLVAFVGGRW